MNNQEFINSHPGWLAVMLALCFVGMWCSVVAIVSFVGGWFHPRNLALVPRLIAFPMGSKAVKCDGLPTSGTV
jgi:hypothetical protein